MELIHHVANALRFVFPLAADNVIASRKGDFAVFLMGQGAIGFQHQVTVAVFGFHQAAFGKRVVMAGDFTVSQHDTTIFLGNRLELRRNRANLLQKHIALTILRHRSLPHKTNNSQLRCRHSNAEHRLVKSKTQFSIILDFVAANTIFSFTALTALNSLSVILPSSLNLSTIFLISGYSFDQAAHK